MRCWLGAYLFLTFTAHRAPSVPFSVQRRISTRCGQRPDPLARFSAASTWATKANTMSGNSSRKSHTSSCISISWIESMMTNRYLPVASAARTSSILSVSNIHTRLLQRPRRVVMSRVRRLIVPEARRSSAHTYKSSPWRDSSLASSRHSVDLPVPDGPAKRMVNCSLAGTGPRNAYHCSERGSASYGIRRTSRNVMSADERPMFLCVDMTMTGSYAWMVARDRGYPCEVRSSCHPATCSGVR